MADNTLEKVSNGEFEQVAVVGGPARQGEARLEAQRTERREPADARSHAVEEPERKVAAPLAAAEDVLGLREDVAGVVEDHALHARRLEERELDLPVGDQLLVAAHREVDER